MVTKTKIFDGIDNCEVVKCYEPFFIMEHPKLCGAIAILHKIFWLICIGWMIGMILLIEKVMPLEHQFYL